MGDLSKYFTAQRFYSSEILEKYETVVGKQLHKAPRSERVDSRAEERYQILVALASRHSEERTCSAPVFNSLTSNHPRIPMEKLTVSVLTNGTIDDFILIYIEVCNWHKNDCNYGLPILDDWLPFSCNYFQKIDVYVVSIKCRTRQFSSCLCQQTIEHIEKGPRKWSWKLKVAPDNIVVIKRAQCLLHTYVIVPKVSLLHTWKFNCSKSWRSFLYIGLKMKCSVVYRKYIFLEELLQSPFDRWWFFSLTQQTMAFGLVAARNRFFETIYDSPSISRFFNPKSFRAIRQKFQYQSMDFTKPY